MQNKFDAIIIGSGIGGMTVASIMTQLKGWKVLILEKHWVCGGFTHTFSRPGGYEWDVGLHYVGDMSKGKMTRDVFDFITKAKVAWQKMPEDFDKFVYPDFSFDVPSNKAEYIKRLIGQFPKEETAIKKYFRDIDKAMAWFSKEIMVKATPTAIAKPEELINSFGNKLALSTTAEYLNRNIKDERLKAVLTSQWGDYGLPPSKSAFVLHAVVTSSYFDGGYYPVGGAGTIAKAVNSIVKENGGDCLVNSEVKELLLEQNRAIGVKLHSGKEYFAPVIVSNIGALNSYNKLIPKMLSPGFNDSLNSLAKSAYSNVTLYIGFKESPEKLGFKGENHWIYSSYDHDAAAARQDELINSRVSAVFLSFASLRDPAAKKHTAEIISPTSYRAFAKWQGTKWMKRGEDYEQLKEKISRALIDFVEERYPGFAELIDYYELSTPLTNESFTGHHNGTIYGLAGTPERFAAKYLKPKTSIDGFYLSGTDVACLGIVGAMMGGVASSARLLGGAGFMMIMKEAKKFSNANPV